MDDREAKELMDGLAEFLRPHLARSDALRRAAAILGRWLVAQAADQTPARADLLTGNPLGHTVATAGAPEPAADAEPPQTAIAPAAGTPASSLVTEGVPLRLGDHLVEVKVRDDPAAIEQARRAAQGIPGPGSDTAAEPEPAHAPNLELIALRSRLKAEGCRLTVERRAAGPAGAWDHALQERIRGVLARAKALPECFIWSLWREKDPPADAPLRTIASCYEALAEAADAMVQVERSEPRPEEQDVRDGMHLLAEAQSMLRVALGLSWLTRDDQDQFDAHLWLRDSTAARRLFVERHMRLDDPADPASAEDLRARTAELLRRLRDRADGAKRVQQTLNRIRHHARILPREGEADAAYHWSRIAAAAEELAAAGVRPGDPRLLEALSDAAGLDPSAEARTEFLSRALAAAAERAGPEPPVAAAEPERVWSARVARARLLLAGRSIVVIGGEPRPEAIARLREALGLGEVYWPALTEHGSGAGMRSPIERPDTAAVVIIIKLTGHLHADQARAWARAAGKPCVSLKAGHNPEQVAEALIEQADEQLSGGVKGPVGK